MPAASPIVIAILGFIFLLPLRTLFLGHDLQIQSSCIRRSYLALIVHQQPLDLHRSLNKGVKVIQRHTICGEIGWNLQCLDDLLKSSIPLRLLFIWD